MHMSKYVHCAYTQKHTCVCGNILLYNFYRLGLVKLHASF